MPLSLSSFDQAPASPDVGIGTLIHPSAVIGPNVTIGAGCIIKPGAVIGMDGFGYERDQEGRWVLKAHEFGVVIEDDVHIGANTCIDRGSWRDTRIMNGVRIDNLVHVAHNVMLGPHCVVVAQAELSGSVTVGMGAWIGPKACVKQRVSVGRMALVGMGAVVLEDVAAHTTVVGNPARVINAEVGVRDRM